METLNQYNQFQKDAIQESRQSGGFKVQSFLIDLTTAKTEQDPFVIGFPFKTIAFENATADSVSVNCKFNSNDQGVSSQVYKDNAVVQTNKMFSGAYLYWSAQPGQSIRVTVYLDSEYTTGSLKNSGTIAVSGITNPVIADDPNTLTITNPVIGAATATKVVTGSTANRKIYIENNDTEDIYLGADNTVTNSGATKGITIPMGMTYQDEFKGDLWLYSVGGNAAGVITVAVESKV